MTVSRHLIGVISCASAILAAAPAWPSGYFIDQQSVPGLGRCNAANVAAAYDPSTIFFNPAGVTELWNGEASSDTRKASVGLSVIIPNSEIRNNGSTTATPGTLGFSVPSKGQDETNPTQPTPVGNIYLAQRLPNSRFYFGLGITSPFGLAAKYDEDWFGRYNSTEIKLLTINVGPTVAYKVSEQLSIGGGVDFQYAYAELTSAIPNPSGSWRANPRNRCPLLCRRQQLCGWVQYWAAVQADKSDPPRGALPLRSKPRPFGNSPLPRLRRKFPHWRVTRSLTCRR